MVISWELSDCCSCLEACGLIVYSVGCVTLTFDVDVVSLVSLCFTCWLLPY